MSIKYRAFGRYGVHVSHINAANGSIDPQVSKVYGVIDRNTPEQPHHSLSSLFTFPVVMDRTFIDTISSPYDSYKYAVQVGSGVSMIYRWTEFDTDLEKFKVPSVSLGSNIEIVQQPLIFITRYRLIVLLFTDTSIVACDIERATLQDNSASMVSSVGDITNFSHRLPMKSKVDRGFYYITGNNVLAHRTLLDPVAISAIGVQKPCTPSWPTIINIGNSDIIICKNGIDITVYNRYRDGSAISLIATIPMLASTNFTAYGAVKTSDTSISIVTSEKSTMSSMSFTIDFTDTVVINQFSIVLSNHNTSIKTRMPMPTAMQIQGLEHDGEYFMAGLSGSINTDYDDLDSDIVLYHRNPASPNHFRLTATTPSDFPSELSMTYADNLSPYRPFTLMQLY